MPNRRAGRQTDLAKTSGKVTVNTTTTAILGNSPGRLEVTIVNVGANIVDLAFATAETQTSGTSSPTAPTAVAGQGLRLAAGGSWTSNSYSGPIAGIATTAASDVSVAEF